MRKSLALMLALAVACPAVAQKEKAGKGGKGGKGGPKHSLALPPPPARDCDVILARPTDRSVTVNVLCHRAAAVHVTYAEAAADAELRLPARTVAAGETANFELAGLRPSAEYRYSVHAKPAGAADPVEPIAGSFRTRRGRGEPFVFTLQSDSHLDQNTRPALYARTLANAKADRPDFHVDLGDTFMTDKYPRHQDALPQYLDQRYYLGLIGRTAPVFLVAGNHDGERLDRFDGSADCMPAWSCRQRQRLFPPPFPNGFYTGNAAKREPLGLLGNYYAWEWGDALLVALDPFWTTDQRGRNRGQGNWARTLGQAQHQWLAQTLAKSQARFKFVFIHHLVGGLDDSARGGAEAAELYEWGGKGKSGDDEFRDKRPGWKAPIHRLLVEHRVTAVFHGHDHFFAKQELDGVLYMMVPQPGNEGFDRLRGADEYGYLRGDFLPPSGHLRVTVDAEDGRIEYVRAFLPSAERANRANGEVAHRVRIGARKPGE